MRLILALTLLPFPALAEGVRQFTLVNHTGVAVTELYASPTNTDSWEEDILDGDPLPDMGVLTFGVEDGRTYCAYDIKAVFADGDEVLDALDVCHSEVLVLETTTHDGHEEKPTGREI